VIRTSAHHLTGRRCSRTSMFPFTLTSRGAPCPGRPQNCRQVSKWRWQLSSSSWRARCYTKKNMALVYSCYLCLPSISLSIVQSLKHVKQTTITILGIIHRPISLYKTRFGERFCRRLQVVSTQGVALSIGPNWVVTSLKRRLSPFSIPFRFK
jgi:hypothetical protein